MTNPEAPHGGYGSVPPPANWQAYPPPGYPPRQSPTNPGRPPNDKSVGAALFLTFLFGPLGLFYASILGGFIMSLLFMVVITLAVVTLGIGLVLLAAIWPITMVWSAISASMKHRDFQTWQARVMAQGYPR